MRLHTLLLFSSVSFLVVEQYAHVSTWRERSEKIKMASNSPSVIFEIKFIKARNAVIHAENCQLS